MTKKYNYGKIASYCGEMNGVRLAWMYYDEYIKASDREISLKTNTKRKVWNVKQLICLNNLKIYDCARDTMAGIGLKFPTSINYCCTGRNKISGKTQNGEKLVWLYLEDYLFLNLENISIFQDEENLLKWKQERYGTNIK